MSAIKENLERPSTLRERRLVAEELYGELYTRFGTHNFSDWLEPDGENIIDSVPPYCYYFDEYLGVVIGLVRDMGPNLDKMFPNPDAVDLNYIEDTLFLIDKTVGFGRVYNCTKGSKLIIIPELYRAHLAPVYAWLEAKKQELINETSLQDVSVLEQNPPCQAISEYALSLSSKLFRNGFTIEKLTQLLISLEILTESGGHTSGSKPRNWRAVIESLRENKRLVHDSNTALFNLLKEQYSYPYKIRAIQSPFIAKNSDTETIYERAQEWCAINK